MLTRSRVIAGASGYAGEPPDEPLPTGIPHWLRYEMAAEIETELLRDHNLSVQNRTMSRVPLHLAAGQREVALPSADLEDPVFVTMSRENEPNLVPIPVEISNVVLSSTDARLGKPTISFYDDKPQRGILSWVPDGGETLTVWYDRSPPTDPSAEQSTFRIQNSYVPLLKLLLAAQMLEMLKQPIGEMLKSRIARGMAQWEKFVKSGKQEGLVEKTTYLDEQRGSRSQWDAWPGRINFE